ncbi:MAG: DEAD/DEAH box helicase family protein, partial [Pseudomonadales bacterium]
MDISANFAFLEQEFFHAAESASNAERQIYVDPRASCFHARHALENLVKRIYHVDKALTPPKVQSLDEYIRNPAFRELMPEAVWQKTQYIRIAGNKAVHGKKTPSPENALDLVRELSHVMYWAGRTYLRKGADNLKGKSFDESLIPKAASASTTASIAELEALKAERDAADEARREVESEIATLREQIAAIKAENEAIPETHDWNEDKTRKLLIDLALQRAGWALDQARDREYEVTGMPSGSGIGYVDYVLWGDDGKPLAVVEAKKTTVDPEVGQQQAKLYADCMEAMHGQRPIIFFTNGYKTFLWDDRFYPPRPVAGFYKKDELASLIHRREQREPLDVAQVKDAIVERYYQKRAIGSIGEQFAQARRKALLVMATGTGKTRTAIALVDLLQRAGWVKRALFLADRVSLVNQAVSAFKTHLPESSPVNLVTEKDKAGRVYVCTYPTMMGLIDETRGNEARFSVGHFDLVIIDEAHRSVYQKFGAIFSYFDSLLVGLTATPRDQVDRNTYSLFDLEPGMPTDAYELETAVADGFLVPPQVQQIDLKFPREGIDYDSLSDEEKEQWEALDWGDDVDENGLPDHVNASAINSWLFNKDTVDKVLQHLMQHGHKVEGGDRLAKTILFARNHEHAKFIEKRFNHHYPHYKGHFARIIDNYAKYPQSLLDDFSQKDKEPHLAISVDMLDTGIDIPEVANLVFFKPVYSKIKFWQMIGRGTRLCPDLFGPDDDKLNFRVFDFCFNFDFFKENPDGIERGGGVPLGTRLFRARVQLVGHIQAVPELDSESALTGSLTRQLYDEVAAMNCENFIVRMHQEAVERFQKPDVWTRLDDADREVLQQEVAGLPSEIET